MTVKEMIEKLSKFDDDAIVMINDEGWFETPNYIEEHDNHEIVIQCIDD